MPRFAANLHYLFNEHPFEARFEAAAAQGFRGVEAQVPWHVPAARFDALCRAAGVAMVLLDTPQGDWDKGERGLAALPGREAEFRDGVKQAADYAAAVGCDCVHVIAGTVPAGVDRAGLRPVYLANLAFAAEELGKAGVVAVIEPINPHLGIVPNAETYTTFGMHGFYLTSVDQALDAIRTVGHPNLKLHLDFYHLQMTEGRLAETFRRVAPLTKHLQMAGVPGRNEPDVGEINYPYVFDVVDELGFDGWIGCEYRPRGGTVEGLRWAARYGIGPGRV